MENAKEDVTQKVSTEPAGNAGAGKMSEAKFKRIIVALTVGAVVFLAFLVMFMCYQLIKIGVERNKLNQLKADIAAYEREYKEGEETIDIRRQRLYIERRARELGYHYVIENP